MAGSNEYSLSEDKVQNRMGRFVSCLTYSWGSIFVFLCSLHLVLVLFDAVDITSGFPPNLQVFGPLRLRGLLLNEHKLVKQALKNGKKV